MSRPIQKQQAIIEAALKLFVERGIEGTTTREIAALAKVGEGTMFRHYKSKEALAWAIFDEPLSAFLQDMEDTILKHATMQQKLRAIVEQCYVLFETDRPRCSYLLLSEHTVARRMPVGYKTPISILVRLIEASQTRGEVRPMDSQLAAALIFGAVLRVPIFKIYGRLHKDLRDMVDEVTETVWKMMQA